jgi:hypothetical protein
VGVDHDYDVIWLWLNPLLNFTIFSDSPKNINWTGYNFDADDVPEMDIYGVYLGWLTGRLGSPGPGSSDFAPLARTWAGLPSNGQIWPSGTRPSLLNASGTAIDPTVGAAIAASDPFSNLSYTVTIPAGTQTSSDGRFTLTGNQVVDYVQPGPGGQPYTQTLGESTTKTQTQGQGAPRSRLRWNIVGKTSSQLHSWKIRGRQTSPPLTLSRLLPNGALSIPQRWPRLRQERLPALPVAWWALIAVRFIRDRQSSRFSKTTFTTPSCTIRSTDREGSQANSVPPCEPTHGGTVALGALLFTMLHLLSAVLFVHTLLRSMFNAL